VNIIIPFDENVLKAGASVALAIKLYKEEVLSLGSAAKCADCTIVEFIEHLGAANVPSVCYSAQELDEELVAIG